MKYLAFLCIIVFSNCSKTCDPDIHEIGIKLKDILTSKTWIFSEISTNIEDKTYYYKRGALNNTVNYDAFSIKFNADNSGILFDGNVQTQLELNFDLDNPYKLKFKVFQSGQIIDVTWSDLEINSEYLSYTEYYSKNGILLFSKSKLIPM